MKELDGRAPLEALLDVSSHPIYPKFDFLGRRMAITAADYLTRCLQDDLIKLSEIKSIVEFGTGDGTGTLATTRLAEVARARVIALERSDEAKEIIDFGILPAQQVKIEDGIASLDAMRESGETCDLLAGFLFSLGKSRKGKLIHRLIPAARGVLSPHGKMLLTSDNKTINAVEKVFQMEGIDYNRITAGRGHFYIGFPHSGLVTSLKQKPT